MSPRWPNKAFRQYLVTGKDPGLGDYVPDPYLQRELTASLYGWLSRRPWRWLMVRVRGRRIFPVRLLGLLWGAFGIPRELWSRITADGERWQAMTEAERAERRRQHALLDPLDRREQEELHRRLRNR